MSRDNAVGIVLLAVCGLALGVMLAYIRAGERPTYGGPGWLAAVLGVLFIALVQNAMIINGVGVFWQGIIIGSVLLLSVSLDRFKQTHRG